MRGQRVSEHVCNACVYVCQCVCMCVSVHISILNSMRFRLKINKDLTKSIGCLITTSVDWKGVLRDISSRRKEAVRNKGEFNPMTVVTKSSAVAILWHHSSD